MPYSYNIYSGNGSTTQYPVAFPYIRKEHVVAYVNYTLTSAFTWVNDSTIQFTTAPGAGVRVEIRRYSPTSSRLVDYADGSTLVAADLDTDSTQHLYKEQELDDDIKQSVYVDPTTGLPTASAQRITNVADPINAQDVATKNYADGLLPLVVNPTTPTPPAGGWQIGREWLQNDANKTLSYWTGSAWSGITSGGTFTVQPTVVYVDNVNGSDTNDGHRIINPMKTIKAAVASASAGWIIKVAPGVYQESLPIDITVANLSIVGEAQRSCFVHPTVATQEQIMFRCNSGTYIDGFTFAGLKASGARGGHPIDTNATYGLPTNQGWVAGFYPGCSIKKSPYINNCTNFADSGIDNSAFDPNNYAGTGGDLTSAPAGGGIIVDGSVPSVSSPLRSFVVNEFTQVCLDGPGLLVCNNGYAQAVSFFGLFCHYHAKALSGGQINMEVGTTDFGRYGLIADGKSSSAIFTATANGAASASATTFAINAPTAGGTWFGDATRPAINMLVQIGSDIYPILSSTANGAGWNVVISRPNPANRAENLGLLNGHANGAAVSFFLRSLVSTASHTMEYAGSGTDYTALPENGGVPNETNESVNLNNGRVWLTSTDQSGKFKVGDTFQVDQQTGFVTIDPQSVATNLVSDLTPELGGNLDVLTRNIYSSVGPIKFNTSSTERVRIDSSGKVGIGTSAPLSLLSISTTLGASVFDMTVPGVASGGFYIDNTSPYSFVSTANAFAWKVWNGAGYTERMRIDSSGNLGVGTSSPSLGKLQVYAINSDPAAIPNAVYGEMAANVFPGTSNTTAGKFINRAFSGSVYGVYGETTDTGTASVTAAGYFTCAGNVYQPSYGVYAQCSQPDVNALGTAYAGYFKALSGGTGTGGTIYGLRVENTAAVGGTSYGALISTVAGPSTVIPFRVDHAGTERMKIDSNGFANHTGAIGRGAPVTKTGAFTVGIAENWLICNGTASITVTLPTASAWTGREIMLKTIAAFTVISASSNVVPLAGGAAGTAILAATAGKYVTLVSDGTNWIIMQAN